MDRNHFTPFIVDDPGMKTQPMGDRRCLMLQFATAACSVFWTLAVVFSLMMVNGNWRTASSMQCAGQIEASR